MRIRFILINKFNKIKKSCSRCSYTSISKVSTTYGHYTLFYNFNVKFIETVTEIFKCI